MELIFDHTLGKQEHQDLVICRPMAIVDIDEEHEALDRGWLALDTPPMLKGVLRKSSAQKSSVEYFRGVYEITSNS